MSSANSDLSDLDAVVIDRDDISNYNPAQILPESPETIRKIRAWLEPTAYALGSSEYHKHLASHVAGTGAWLTSSHTYQEWLNDDKHGMLWIKGIPGSGKSVIAATLIDDLKRTHPGVPVLYFFFRQIIDANHEPVALLRDWLDQMLSYSPPMQKQLKELCEKQGRSITSMSMEDLWKELRLACAGLPDKVFCVADALDEMDRGNDAFLQELAVFGQWMPKKVKLLITSRPVPSVEGPLRTANTLQIRLKENLVDMDISSFVQYSLRPSSIAPSDQDLIKEAIPGRANGLFLYAKLAMDAFLEPGANIDEVLRALPADLNDMYTNLLHEHAQRSGVPSDIQLLILQWVTHATRPLRLLEIAEMINVTYHSEVERNLKASKNLVRAACGPLLEILPDETVCVVHHSLTEYLKGTTRDDDESGYRILRPGSTHARLALSCLSYLRSDCFNEVKVYIKHKMGTPSRFEWDDDLYDDEVGGRPAPGPDMAELRLKYPFIEYAVSNWHTHVIRSTAAGEDQADVIFAINKFFEDTHRKNAFLKFQWSKGEAGMKGVTALHIASSLGLIAWLQTLLQNPDNDVNSADLWGKTPLWWAARNGYGDIVRLLVKAGADPDVDEKYAGLKPLHKAAQDNHTDVVKALLEAGVDPLTQKTRENPGNWCGNAPRSTGHTALMYACCNGHTETVEAFLPFLKDIEAVYRALGWAAEKGRSEIVRKILEYPGIDVNNKVRGDTPLFLACGSLDMKTIEILVEAGADASVPNFGADDEFDGCGAYLYDPDEKWSQSRRLTSLHRLCGAGRNRYNQRKMSPEEWHHAISLLVQAGADVHCRTPNGATSLHHAVDNPILVRILLDAGADANAVTNDGRAPIHQVTNLESLILLVEHGHANINMVIPGSGKTPLLNLISSYHTNTISKLLEYRPDCNIKDKDGNGVLHATLNQGSIRIEILKVLLDAGADPNLRNRAGETPIHMLRLENKESPDVLDVLMKAGAEIDAKDVNGSTALCRALRGRPWRNGDEDHADLKCLIDRGASLQARDYKGRTLLHKAIQHHEGRPPSISQFDPKTSRLEYLLSLGLDPHAIDYDGNNLLHQLAAHQSVNDSNRRFAPLWRQLFGLGLSLSEKNHRGWTPLHVLAARRYAEPTDPKIEFSLDVLISMTKDLNVVDLDGLTPLHLAATVSEFSCKRLLDAGADASIHTFEQMNILHLAARCRQVNVVGLLFERFGDKVKDIVNVKDSDGHTPLIYACRSGRPETVRLLLDHGADVTISGIFEACFSFEDELKLWSYESVSRNVKNNIYAAGLKPQDRTRPDLGESYSNSGSANLTHSDCPRLEEIIALLLDKGASLDTIADSRSYGSFRYGSGDSFGPAVTAGNDYTVACFVDALERQPEAAKMRYTTRWSTFVQELVKQRREAVLRTLRDSKQIIPGESNSCLIIELLKRREYYAIPEFFHLGVDFVHRQKHQSEKSTNLGLLAKFGFAELLEQIGSLEVEKTFKEGTWHAVGDKTQPSLGVCTLPKIEDNKDGKTNGDAPLLLEALSSKYPNMEVVRVLVEKLKVDINELKFSEQYGNRTLEPTENAVFVLAKGHYWWHVAQALPYLLQQGVDIHARKAAGVTALHVALGGGGGYRSVGAYHKDAARLLVQAGADVNAVDDSGNSCLAYAGTDVELVRLLIDNGATVKADALFSAIGAAEVEVVEALLSAGADANMRREPWSAEEKKKVRSRGWSAKQELALREMFPIHFAACKHKTDNSRTDEERKAADEKSIQLIRTLLAHGADPFAKYPEQALDLVVERTVTKEEESDTVLHKLLMDGKLAHPFFDVPSLDVNTRDSKGRTLLHAACYAPNGPDGRIDAPCSGKDSTAISVIDKLLELGADPLARDVYGRNAIHAMYTPYNKHYLRHVERTNSLKKLATQYPELLTHIGNTNGQTPLLACLYHATLSGAANEVHILLEAGADPFVKTNEGDTPLHILAAGIADNDNIGSLFSTLLARGLDINARNNLAETPLHKFFAKPQHRPYEPHIIVGDIDTINLFSAAGADFFARNSKGQGLLHVEAKAKGSVRRFKMLMRRGLDPLAEDEARQTSLDVAAAVGYENVLGLFERDGEGEWRKKVGDEEEGEEEEVRIFRRRLARSGLLSGDRVLEG